VTRIDVESALEMQKATQAALPADIAVLSAAVADWRVDTIAGGKIKKGPGGPPTLALIENPDILAGLSAPGPLRPALVIGFAAETSDLEANARAKLSRKGCDWIVGNDVSDEVFGSDGNAVLLVTAQGAEVWPRQSKTAVAQALADRIADHFKSAQ
jgi:phosphopantothenoylcysteine decarboxylase/phosphopantothenate--cysteine ligase